LNLVDNAIKFTDSGGVVVCVSPVFHSDGAVRLHFVVRDTGRGFETEQFERAVQPFGQAQGSGTQPVGRAGLGLAVSSRLIGRMGGSLWAKSAPGMGSSFHFTATFGRACSSTPSPHDLERLRGVRVLIADESAISRRGLQQSLSRWQMKTTVAASTPEAREVMRNAMTAGTPFDVLLIDGLMPGFAGSGLIREIRENPELGGPDVTALYSASLVSVTETAEVCPRHVLVKPVSEAALLKAVSEAVRAIDRRRKSHPAVNVEGNARRFHILVADDDAIGQAVTVCILRKAGYETSVASNGTQAVEAYDRSGIDLVLMDIQMPEMSGLEATRQIRRKEAVTGGHVPILALTAHAMTGDRERCLEAGMDEHISKPVHALNLRRVIGQWLNL
jgi:CheY-like chemotaxis protein